MKNRGKRMSAGVLIVAMLLGSVTPSTMVAKAQEPASGKLISLNTVAADGLETDTNLTENESELLDQSMMRASASSEENANSPTAEEGPAKNVLDGNKNTIWHTKYSGGRDTPPFTFTILFDGEYQINKYVYSPRTRSDNGIVTAYELYAVKADDSRELVDSGTWENNTEDKTVVFAPVNAAGMELKVIDGSGGFGSASEINIYKLMGSDKKPVTVTSIELNKKKMALSNGESETLSVIVKPDLVSQEVVWKSEKNEIAEVDQNGVVTAKAVGSTVITATSAVTPELSAACTVTVAASNKTELVGNGAAAAFDGNSGKMTLYKVAEDGTREQMSKGSAIGYPMINDVAVTDFEDFKAKLEEGISGALGVGSRMTITSVSASTGLTRTYVMESADALKGVFYTKTTYTTGNKPYTVGSGETGWFVDNEFILDKPTDQKTIWSYNGGGEGSQSWYDTLQKIDVTDGETFTRENKQDYTAAAIPFADIYSSKGGLSVGDASTTRRELWTPIEEKEKSAQVRIQWPNKGIAANTTAAAGESIITVHNSDYYLGIQGYGKAMTSLGMDLWSEDLQPDSSYDLRWESWGWEMDWTIDLVLGKLDELKELGIKQVTLDDGWYNNAGEWGLNRGKLPNGDADMKRIVDAIHDHGMTAILWWRPCDGGRENSALYKNHKDYFIKNENGSFGKLAGPGGFNSFLGDAGYALCPGSEGAVQSQVDFVTKAIGSWGFDGLKGDYVWSLPKCYEKSHNHKYPEESTEQQAVFYQETYEAMKKIKPEVFNMLCNCGVPEDLYSLPYMTHAASADPTSVDQTRRRVKAYKGLLGDYFPVTTDHNLVWYPSTVGTGAVLIEKRHFTDAGDRAEYEKWLRISQKVNLQKGRCIGDLYSYGYDPYETYVVEKDGVMHYAFYKDGGKYRPSGNPTIELKGLDPNKTYRIIDYVNDDKVIATNLKGDNASFDYSFSQYLLVKAVEITDTEPEPEPEPEPSEGTIVEEDDAAVTYTGDWSREKTDNASGGSCQFTNKKDAAVTFTFTGTSVAWFGQKDSNFGTAEVYIDNVLNTTVSCEGAAKMKVKLFEITDLQLGTHTIKIVNKTDTIDVDYFMYKVVEEEKPEELNKKDLQILISIADTYNMEEYLEGDYKGQFNVAIGRARDAYQYATTQSAIDAELEYLTNAMLRLRKVVDKNKLPSGTLSVESVTVNKTSRKIFDAVVAYVVTLKTDKLMPEIKTIFEAKLAAAKGITATATQDQLNKAWAELANIVQYFEWETDPGEEPKPEPDAEYTLTFHANGGSSVASIKVKENAAYPALPTSTRSGYTFLGWFTAAQGGTQIKAGDICKQTKDTNLYAQWRQNPKPPVPTPKTYTVTFQAQGGTGAAKITVKENEKYPALPKSTRSGYTFLGWFTAAKGGTQIKAGAICKLTKSSTVYAQWKQNPVPVPTQVKSLKASSNKTTSVKISWKAVKNAKSYTLERATGTSKKWVVVKKGITKTSYTSTKLKASTTYRFRVKAVNKSGKAGKSSSELKTVTAPSKPSLLSVKVKGKSTVLNWKKNTAVSGYKIYVKNPGKKKFEALKKSASGKAASYTIKNLKPGKKYSFMIRSYKKIGKTTVYSAYSKVITITVKK